MRQRRFAEEYLVDLSATKAAIRAGYNPKSAGKSASENLKKPAIRASIDQAMAELSRRTGVSQERVVAELSKVAFAGFDQADEKAVSSPRLEDGKTEQEDSARNPVLLEDAGNGGKKGKPGGKAQGKGDAASRPSGRAAARTGKSGPRDVRLGDKLKALELLGKHLGMFGDRARGTGDQIPQIIDDIGGNNET